MTESLTGVGKTFGPATPFITATVRGNDVHAHDDRLVPWWSYGKTVLASAALTLVAQGGLPLDDPVRGKPFTLRQLLGHRAGLGCYGTLRAYHVAVAAGEPPWSVQELLRQVDADTLQYAPGQGWAYSNVGYLMIRKLIEAAAGLPLGAALERLVFMPLGVSGVVVAQVPADLDGTAWGNARRYHPGWVYHGLLVGKPSAAALFLDRLLGGDLLRPDLLAAMRQGHPLGGEIQGRPWKTASYGLGLMIGRGEPPGEYAGHTGGGPGSVSAVYHRAGGGTGAAFGLGDEPGPVDARAMELTDP